MNISVNRMKRTHDLLVPARKKYMRKELPSLRLKQKRSPRRLWLNVGDSDMVEIEFMEKEFELPASTPIEHVRYLVSTPTIQSRPFYCPTLKPSNRYEAASLDYPIPSAILFPEF